MASTTFFDRLHDDFHGFLQQAQSGIDLENCLRVDLHCHDHNSDTPDELWGRLLRLPETWLKTKTLMKQLQRSGNNLFTITNHNNARSCWPLAEQRDDLLVGAEFTCHFPDIDLSVHILCYGFSQEQEVELNELRHDAYQFVRYTRQNLLPVVLPHPLFFYSSGKRPSLEVLERFAVMFERFEVLNGQRGVWQNTLTRDWVRSLTPERIDQWAEKYELDPHDFCIDPYHKRMTGGSDDHNGLFAGQCGTLLPVSNLRERLAAGETPATLAKEALLYGPLIPFGEVGEEEKLATTFLDYFAQIVLNMRDPGLIRLLLHKGSTQDKVACLVIGNVIQELQRHKYTLKFLETFHQALQGRKPTLLISLNTSKEFKPVLKVVKEIARVRRKEPEQFARALRELIPQLQWQLSKIFFDRLNHQLGKYLSRTGREGQTLHQSLKQFEIPIHFRALVGQPERKQKNMSALNVGDIFDQLSFPALAAGIVLGAGFMGTQILYKNRDFINELAATLNGHETPQRILWLTDTLVDRNGVSTALSQTLKSLQRLGLPIDILTCHPSLESAPHLHVVRPISELSLPSLDEQVLYVPDILKIQKIFEQGGYDQVVCSTELLMGSVALYLKHAFSVPAHFFMHTDWIAYAEQRIEPNLAMHDRLRRLLRGFYQRFDSLITLNEEHAALLASPEFAIEPERILHSAHWPAAEFAAPRPFLPLSERPKRLIYAGRLSPEKGVGDLPQIWRRVREQHPDAELVLAGSGPLRTELEAQLPGAIFKGWIEPQQLASEYAMARGQLLPSTFDTFGCVVIEAMCLGVPTFAYNCKGPASLISDGVNGRLAHSADELAEQLIAYLDSPQQQADLSAAALNSAQAYSDQAILEKLIAQIYQRSG